MWLVGEGDRDISVIVGCIVIYDLWLYRVLRRGVKVKEWKESSTEV